MSSLIEAASIALKWKQYRDAVYKMFTLFESNEDKYIDRIKMLQEVIISFSKQNNLATIPAITKIADMQTEDTIAVQLLAAGYELVNGTDYTKQ